MWEERGRPIDCTVHLFGDADQRWQILFNGISDPNQCYLDQFKEFFGIIEGVIAKWNPYQITDGGTSEDSQLQGAYYFWLRGTIGIIGKVFGTIDFAIIKADVNIEVKVMVQLTYESYHSIALTVAASVSVSVSISIDLGLFSIRISFSFSMRLKETFTIENGGNSPWQLAAPEPTLLRAPADHRLSATRLPSSESSAS